MAAVRDWNVFAVFGFGREIVTVGHHSAGLAFSFWSLAGVAWCLPFFYHFFQLLDGMYVHF